MTHQFDWLPMMRLSFDKVTAHGQHAVFDVVETSLKGKHTVAQIVYDKWSERWILLHSTGLMETFDSMSQARAGAASFYG